MPLLLGSFGRERNQSFYLWVHTDISTSDSILLFKKSFTICMSSLINVYLFDLFYNAYKIVSKWQD